MSVAQVVPLLVHDSTDPVVAHDALDALETLIILPWNDPLVDANGHDPRSVYVEHFWLGVLGPSTIWLLRRLAAGFDQFPDGFEVDLAETAVALGLSAGGGRHSPFHRTLHRCLQFGMAKPVSYGLAVRRHLPSLSARQLGRLPAGLGAAHVAWALADDRHARDARERERAEVVARALHELGDGPDVACSALVRLGMAEATAAAAVRATFRTPEAVPTFQTDDSKFSSSSTKVRTP